MNLLGTFWGKTLAMRLCLFMACLHALALLAGGLTQSVPLLVVSQMLGGASHLGIFVLNFLFL